MYTKDEIIEKIYALFKAISELGTKALGYGNLSDDDVVSKVNDIAKNAITPVAAVLFSLFAISQLYKIMSYMNDIGAPQGGSARIETVGFSLAKIGFIYWVIKKLSTMMWGLSEVGVYLISLIGKEGGAETDQKLAELRPTIEYVVNDTVPDKLQLWDSVGIFLLLLIAELTVAIVGVVVFVLFYGRMLQLYIMVALAPIPLTTFIHDEQKQIGINFIKSFAAVVLQGGIMMALIYLYSTISWTNIIPQDTYTGMVWGVIGIAVLLTAALATSGSLSRRIVNAM